MGWLSSDLLERPLYMSSTEQTRIRTAKYYAYWLGGVETETSLSLRLRLTPTRDAVAEPRI